MGTRPSPYHPVRSTYLAEEIIRGDPLDRKNPLRWSKVVFNLTGNPNYVPLHPWVSKIVWDCKGVLKIANDFCCYVDDVRIIGRTNEECWATIRRVMSIAQMLGIQDAARKRRKLSKGRNPWAESIVNTSAQEITVCVTEEKWLRGRSIVLKLLETYLPLKGNEAAIFQRKELEQDRGFLVHLGMTYTDIVPYLKGLHLSLDFWRKDRKSDGWELQSEAEWMQFLQEKEFSKVRKDNWRQLAASFKG